jgi:hypothetical protein
MIRAWQHGFAGSAGVKAHMTRQGTSAVVDLSAFRLVQAAFSCDECGRWSLAYAVVEADPWDENAPPNDDLNRVFNKDLRWQPERGVAKSFPDVPEPISEPPSEAHRCRSINAHRGAILLARAVIEATAKDKTITSGNLREKIDKLCAEGHIRAHIAEAAHEARHFATTWRTESSVWKSKPRTRTTC